MEHQILEDLFVDYIIEKVGPNLEPSNPYR